METVFDCHETTIRRAPSCAELTGVAQDFLVLEKSDTKKENFDSCSDDYLLKLLRKIVDDHTYPKERRAEHLAIHFELTGRSIAPLLRFPTMHKYIKKMEKGSWKAKYYSDLQIADLQWVYVKHHGERTNSNKEDGLFANIFTKDYFDIEQAKKISELEWYISNKVGHKGLCLSDDVQADLIMLRTESTKKKMARLLDAADEVEYDLRNAAMRNPRRGEKTLKVISLWKKLWVCRELAGGSLTLTINQYFRMTGQRINESTLRRKLKSIDKALSEVR